MSTLDYQTLQAGYAQGGLTKILLENLRWESGQGENVPLLTGEVAYQATVLAHIGNLAGVLEVTTDTPLTKPTQRQLALLSVKRFPDRLLICTSGNSSTYLWPKKTAAGHAFEDFEVDNSKLPMFLAQRLLGLEFTSVDHRKGITPSMIRERIRGTFDTSKVTKKFYDQFRKQHSNLQDAIVGIPSEDTSAYSSTILNRLMLVYFLQKKHFLNGDNDYLRNCLNRVQELKGPGEFYTFYRDLLLELFHRGFNDAQQEYADPAIAQILGKVPYINGGIFAPNELERKHHIQIPDDVFVSIFDFFDQYIWHLDTRPTGNPNEINPEVMGYIFQQYITFTASGQKEKGAYYTPADVTGYMVRTTLVPRVLDYLVESGVGFDALLHASGQKYINDDMLHGFDPESETWLPAPKDLETCWLGDPLNWSLLDATPSDSAICLPDETWVEMFHRRDRVESQVVELNELKNFEVNYLIHRNLNVELLLQDAIGSIENPLAFEAVWKSVERMSVIDPTCGSGAFLFAAMESLEDIYAALIAKSTEFDSPFNAALANRIAAHQNVQYFIRKHIALSNLYGTDLMAEAIEVSKLRIFLALASCLEDVSEIEPLPDLDFNLKVGNLVVGLKDRDDYTQGQDVLFSPLDSPELQRKIKHYEDTYALYLSMQESSSPEATKFKSLLADSSAILKNDVNKIFGELRGFSSTDLEKFVSENLPFHWVIEFPEVIARGGFDVIIGNPPYIEMVRNASPESGKASASDFPHFQTRVATDFYAICYERSLQLLHLRGRHSFIVPLNLAVTGDFASVRSLISQRFSEFWSTFALRPDSLFRGVETRNTILCLGPGNSQYGTKYNVFSQASRVYMFQTLEFGEIQRVNSLPPFRAGAASALGSAMMSSKFGQPVVNGAQIYMKAIARYWFPVVPGPVPTLTTDLTVNQAVDPYLKSAAAWENENHDVAVAVLAGKLGYLNWSATGDDYHALPTQMALPRQLALNVGHDVSLVTLARKVVSEATNWTFCNNNNGVQTLNVRWNMARAVTDQFDRKLLELTGLLSEWRNLNIWYRQVMRSGGENQNSVYLTHEQQAAIGLNW
jgi:hypothetical protein